MHPAFRPSASELDFEVEGEDVYVLASNARRDASDSASEAILPLERELHTLAENIAWRETHLCARAARWVRSRIIFTALVARPIVGYALFLRYTDAGRFARMRFVEGQYEVEHPDGSVRDEPHWLTSDMTPAQIREL